MKIQMNEIVKTYAGEPILEDLNLEIVKGSKVALVGENGCGKSTLLKILAGLETYQSGSVFIPKEMSVSYMKQVFEPYEKDARTYILEIFKDYQNLKQQLESLEQTMATTDDIETVLKKYTNVQEKFDQIDGYAFENTLESYARGLGVEDHLDQRFDTLSGGQKTRIGLVQMLLSDAEVLCFDEPTNHMDMKGIQWLESFCRNTSKTLVIVSHDRVFLRNIVSVFHDIEDGAIVSYHGDYDTYRSEKTKRYHAFVNEYKLQQKEMQRITLAIRRYRQWANESDNEDFYKRAKMLEKRLERIQALPKPQEIKNKLKLELKVKQRSGEQVVRAENLSIGYTEALLSNLNFEVRWQDHFAIIADNGAGKSTLIKTMMQELTPLEGTLKIGNSVTFGYLSQQAKFKDEQQRILDYIQKQGALSEFTARQNLARFGFYAHDVYKPLSYLSGGEAVRLRLLEIMLNDSNCLILDEPTNHLDIASCEIIEEALIAYEGTLILVSHDRMLLEKLNVIQYRLE